MTVAKRGHAMAITGSGISDVGAVNEWWNLQVQRVQKDSEKDSKYHFCPLWSM